MDGENKQGDILAKLDTIAKQIALQNSFKRMFWVGVVYGIGFFLGSAIIATIALGVFGPMFADVPWVRDSFETGVKLLH